MSFRTLTRAVFSVLGICATGVLILNVETLTTRLGFQAVLADWVAPERGQPSPVWQALSSPPAFYTAILVLGIAVGFWIDVVLKRSEDVRKRVRPPAQAWESCYRKVRAMQRNLEELRAADTNKVPEALPYEILSLHASLRALGIPTPDREQDRWPADDYFAKNWGYLNCIAPFMRDKHKGEAKKMAMRHLRTASLTATPEFQSLPGIEQGKRP